MAQLGRLDATTARRRGNAALMLAALGPWARYNVVNTGPGTASMKLALVLPEDGPDVAATIAAFAEGGVECQPGYAPCHLGIHDVRASVPWTERVWQRVVCVPLETRLADPRRLTSALRQLVLPPSGRGVRPEPSAERR